MLAPSLIKEKKKPKEKENQAGYWGKREGQASSPRGAFNRPVA